MNNQGRPRLTEEAKTMKGTARKDRVAVDPVQASPLETVPEPPNFLNKIGRKQWKKLTKLLQSEGILAETDLDSLGLYCMHLQIAEQAAETLKSELFYPCVNGNGETYYMGMASVLKIFNDASTAAMKFAVQFGFTPVARKNVPAPKPKKGKSKLEMLFEKRSSDDVFKIA